MTDDAKREWCWPFLHQWAKWVDKGGYQVWGSGGHKPDSYPTEYGIIQERRCRVCGLAQRKEIPER